MRRDEKPVWFQEALGFSHAIFVWGAGPKTPWSIVARLFWARVMVVITGTLCITYDALSSGSPVLFWIMLALWGFGGYYVYYAIKTEARAAANFGDIRNAIIAARIAATWYRTSDYPGGFRKMDSAQRFIDSVYCVKQQPHTE